MVLTYTVAKVRCSVWNSWLQLQAAYLFVQTEARQPLPWRLSFCLMDLEWMYALHWPTPVHLVLWFIYLLYFRSQASPHLESKISCNLVLKRTLVPRLSHSTTSASALPGKSWPCIQPLIFYWQLSVPIRVVLYHSLRLAPRCLASTLVMLPSPFTSDFWKDFPVYIMKSCFVCLYTIVFES